MFSLIFHFTGAIHGVRVVAARGLSDNLQVISTRRCLDEGETPFKPGSVCDIVSEGNCDKCHRRYLCPCEETYCDAGFDLSDDWCVEVLGLENSGSGCQDDCVDYVEECCDLPEPEECDVRSVTRSESSDTDRSDSPDAGGRSADVNGGDAWFRVRNGETFDGILGDFVCLHYRDDMSASACRLYQNSCPKKWRLRSDGLLEHCTRDCLTATPLGGLALTECDNTLDRQIWEQTNSGQLRNLELSECLEALGDCKVTGRSEEECSRVDVVLLDCASRDSQEWTFVETK